MIKKILIILILCFAAKVFAEDLTPINTMPVPEVAEICLGVTDDASKAPIMLRANANGYLKVTLGTALSYSIDSITAYPPDPSYTYISTAASTQVKSAAGYLFNIIVGDEGSADATVTIYDNTSCATTTVGVIDAQAVRGSIAYNLKFNTGLCISTAGTTPAKVTVVWK